MNWVRKLGVLCLLSALLGGCAVQTPQPEASAETAAAAERAQIESLFQDAVAAMAGGDTEAARRLFEQLAKDHPQYTGPAANLGILAYQQGDLTQAQGWFEAVLAQDADHLVALNHLGVIARHQGDFEAAERYYRRALAARDDYAPALLNLAFLLDIYLGRPDEALALYQRYEATAAEPHPRLKDWMFDAKNRI